MNTQAFTRARVSRADKPSRHTPLSVLVGTSQTRRPNISIACSIPKYVGDSTATVGDPTGRSSTRPPLPRDEVLVTAATYTDQAFKIIDKSKTET